MEILEEISTENDKDSNDGYFLRSKKRKLDNDQEEATLFESLPITTRKRKCPVLFVPTEILRNILKLVPYHQLSNNIRLVNRRFRVVAEDILSTRFQLLEGRIKSLMESTLEALQAVQDDMELRCLCKMLNMLEIVGFQQTVVTTTIWRYVYNHRYNTYRSSMYAGSLLDTYEEFLWTFTHAPNSLYSVGIVRDYAMPQVVIYIIQMTKTFCLHFEKINEEYINNNLFVSGCKLLDILDCASFAQKDVIFERVAEDKFSARYNYFFNNSWFVALDIQSEKQMSWKQKQRMMHMRVRRIVLAHTEMCMQHDQFERELTLRIEPINRIKKPSNNVYTGYGDIQDKFFYYGVMNDGAYTQKFHPEELLTEEDLDDILGLNEELMPEQVQEEANHNNTDHQAQQEVLRVPYLGLHIDVKVNCPLTHAPIKFLEDKFPADPNSSQPRNLEDFKKEKYLLKMEFQCYGAQYPRLPTSYLYNCKQQM